MRNKVLHLGVYLHHMVYEIVVPNCIAKTYER